ncbi:MAG: zinc ABC transporter substrate-binding protein [Simkaniaceae bacterium]|nr:zinc ABC transporter substrate-binding protein [Simkaniaceae bacterium]
MQWVMALFLFLMASCSKISDGSIGRLDEWMVPNGKIKVLATTRMIDDLVSQIGGDRVDMISLIVGDLDPHTYEIVKGDDEKISFADIIFANGLGLEHGASLQYRLKRHPQIVFLGDEIYKQAPERMVVSGGSVDPHIWTDMALFSEVIGPIVKQLAAFEPENREMFEKNGAALKGELIAEHNRLKAIMASIPDEKRFLVTSHDAFHYFARAYLGGEERFAAPEGLSPDGQMSARDIGEIVKYLSEHGIGVVFPESNVSRAALKKIVESSPMKVVVVNEPLYGDSMGEESYIGMMRHNVEKIYEYLK